MVTPDLSTSAIRVLDSNEFGATRLVHLFARRLEFPQLIHPDHVPWRDEALALIVERLVFPLREVLGGGVQRAQILVELLANQESIQEKLAEKHIKKGCLVLFPLTAWEPLHASVVLQAGLLTNTEGCPLGIVDLSTQHQDVQNQLASLVDKYDLKALVIAGNFTNERQEDIRTIKTSLATPKSVLDGCIFIQDNIGENIPTSLQLGDIDQQRRQIEMLFKNVIAENQITRDCAVTSRLLLEMLSYYLRWHLESQLKEYCRTTPNAGAHAWTLTTVLERLKSIRSQTVQFEDTAVAQVKSCLSSEQAEIISIFGFSADQFNAAYLHYKSAFCDLAD